MTSELRGDRQGVHAWCTPKGSASTTFVPLLSALADLINDNNDNGDNHKHSWNANDGLSSTLNEPLILSLNPTIMNKIMDN